MSKDIQSQVSVSAKNYNHGELDQFYVEGTHPAIISREKFEKVQSLWQMKTKHFQAKGREETGPLAQKMICGNCGALLYRRVTRKGTITWSCERHLKNAASCPVCLIPQGDIYEAFVRVYNKLRLHEGLILRPVLNQMESLKRAVQKENPAMLEINRAIAQAAEQNHKVSILQSNGLLDSDACSAKLASLEAQLTRLRTNVRPQ